MRRPRGLVPAVTVSGALGSFELLNLGGSADMVGSTAGPDQGAGPNQLYY